MQEKKKLIKLSICFFKYRNFYNQLMVSYFCFFSSSSSLNIRYINPAITSSIKIIIIIWEIPASSSLIFVLSFLLVLSLSSTFVYFWMSSVLVSTTSSAIFWVWVGFWLPLLLVGVVVFPCSTPDDALFTLI